MEWSEFWSAALGGALVIAAQYSLHRIQRNADAEDKQELIKERIRALVYEVQNWFEGDMHLVTSLEGEAAPPIQAGHPVYSLAAVVMSAGPTLMTHVPQLMTESSEYFKTTRVLFHNASPDEKMKLIDRTQASSSAVIDALRKILSDVTDVLPDGFAE